MSESTTVSVDIPWTLFSDMHSGGGCKEPPYENIYVQLPEAEAINWFYNRFGHNPRATACNCCGPNYSISESPSLYQASGYHRNCAWREGGYVEEPGRDWGKYLPIEEYTHSKGVLVVRRDEVKPEELADPLDDYDYDY